MRKRWVVVLIERVVWGGRTKVVPIKNKFTRKAARRLANELNRQAILQGSAKKKDMFLYTVKRVNNV